MMPIKDQDYEAFLVLDFEATCIKDMRLNPQEIIEFSCTYVFVQEGALREGEKFQSHVKPVFRPKLSPFCIKLTGITQEIVDQAEKFKEVFAKFVQWVKDLNIAGRRVVFVTCGDWDLKTMLPAQCELSKVALPEFTRSWINLKKEFERIENTMISRNENDLLQMLRCYNLEFQGEQHKAWVDVINICRLLEAMCAKAKLQATERPETFVDGRMPEIVWQATEERPSTSSVGGIGSRTLPEHVKKCLSQKSKAQKYDYILVLDFEATCLKDMKIDPQEIIEFPCIILETRTYSIKDVFHHYVKPVKRPRLSPFCTKLTGITQRMVDESKTFPEVFQQFVEWLKDETRDKKFVFATCGDWDLQKMLPAQLQLSGVQDVPPSLRSWINVKKVFQKETEQEIIKERNDLQQMMEMLGLRATGSLHSGIDDVKNIARVVEVLSRFTVLETTGSLL